MDSNYKAFFEFACCWLKQKKQLAFGGITFLVMLFGLLATPSSANDIASHEFLGWQKLTDYSNVLSEVDVQNSVMNFGAFSTCPKPTSGTANIDGNYSEWDLTNDFFADMYEAGKVDKTLLSKLYVRYDCKTQKLCVLVKTVDGFFAEKLNGEAYVKFGENKIVDGTYGSSYFQWIYKNDNPVGFEACAKVAPGSYPDLNPHLQVKMDRTSAVSMRMIPICLDECPCEFTIECPKKWQGGDKPCDYVAPNFETLKDFYVLGGKVISSCDDVYVKSFSSDGGACAGWLKKMMTLTDGKNDTTCVVQWDFKKDDLTIQCP
ncbi:MAG: hypothetical protein HKN87_15875, partial [Saprospiraceae bacterium]|nr:hypothetical protein [Saprospiraceae bacterium]